MSPDPFLGRRILFLAGALIALSAAGLVYAFGMAPLSCGTAALSAGTHCKVLNAVAWASWVGLPLAAVLAVVGGVIWLRSPASRDI